MRFPLWRTNKAQIIVMWIEALWHSNAVLIVWINYSSDTTLADQHAVIALLQSSFLLSVFVFAPCNVFWMVLLHLCPDYENYLEAIRGNSVVWSAQSLFFFIWISYFPLQMSSTPSLEKVNLFICFFWFPSSDFALFKMFPLSPPPNWFVLILCFHISALVLFILTL